MRGNYIDFISAYCDRWCERCPFTDRCSDYAVRIATAMCEGDFGAGIELAVGAPAIEEADSSAAAPALDDDEDVDVSEADIARIRAELDEQDERIAELPVTTRTKMTMLLSARWLSDWSEQLEATGDARLGEALEVASRDFYFIHLKIRRALRGRDGDPRGEVSGESPVQTDWNGSAKVALLSVVRSLDAWTFLADVTGSEDARQVAQELGMLRRELEAEFPDVWRFVRPGFDTEPAV